MKNSSQKSKTAKNQINPLTGVKTSWDLKKLFYKSEKDPQIEKDAKNTEELIATFVKKYQNKDFTKDVKSLTTALNDYKKLADDTGAEKVMRYFAFRSTLNVNDDVATKKLALFSERFRKAGNTLIFFNLKLGKVPIKQQKLFLKDESLSEYRYFLQQIFEQAKHNLTEPEEKILSLRSNTSSGMWADATEKIVSNRSVKFKGKELHLPEAIETVNTLSWNDKQKLWDLILDELKQISEFSEHEITAIVKHEKVTDELRGYDKPYSKTVLGYENNEQSVEALVEAISKKGFALSKKFYKIKAQIHKQESIPYVNRYESIGKQQKITFAEALEICRKAFYDIKSEYGEIFDRLFINGQVDVYPQKGKRGGAFMASTENLPTLVMLNHKDDFKSLETLAHELGHAVHAEKSKVQGIFYQNFSTTTAETASTLFEQIVLDSVFKNLDDKQKLYFLHDKISRDIATVQRQIACFNFELEMHEHIRSQGTATREELAKLLVKNLKAYCGPSLEIKDEEGYFYTAWSHIRYGFYVYTYAYGHLMSNLMMQKYREDNSYIDKIDHFLSLGATDTVENIFKEIGIDATKTQTFLDSLKTQEQEIKLLEKLTVKSKL